MPFTRLILNARHRLLLLQVQHDWSGVLLEIEVFGGDGGLVFGRQALERDRFGRIFGCLEF